MKMMGMCEKSDCLKRAFLVKRKPNFPQSGALHTVFGGHAVLAVFQHCKIPTHIEVDPRFSLRHTV